MLLRRPSSVEILKPSWGSFIRPWGLVSGCLTLIVSILSSFSFFFLPHDKHPRGCHLDSRTQLLTTNHRSLDVFPTTVGIQETSTLFPIPEQQQHDDHYEGGTLEPHSEEPPTAPTQVLPPQTPTPSPPLLEPGIDGSDSLPPDLLKLYNIPSPRPISDIDNNSGIACQYDSCGDNYQNCELGDNGRNSSFFGGLTQPDCSEAGDMPAAPSRASTMSQIAALAEPDINDVPSLTNPSTLDDKTTVITPVNTNNAEGKGKGNEELPQSKLDNIYLPVVLHASDDALSLRDGNAADLLKGTAEPQEDMQWPLELNDEEDELYEFREGGGWDFSM